MFREYRLKRKMTLEQVAEACDISWRNLVRIENNCTSAKFGTIIKLIKTLNISDEDILILIKETNKK